MHHHHRREDWGACKLGKQGVMTMLMASLDMGALHIAGRGVASWSMRTSTGGGQRMDNAMQEKRAKGHDALAGNPHGSRRSSRPC